MKTLLFSLELDRFLFWIVYNNNTNSMPES
jgi:hypothetical protein